MNRHYAWFQFAVLGGGLGSLVWMAFGFASTNPPLLAAVLVAGIVLSGLRTWLFGVSATAVNFTILLAGMMLLTRAETAFAVFVTVFIQAVRRKHNSVSWTRSAMEVAATCAAVGNAYLFSNHFVLREAQLSDAQRVFPARLILAALAFVLTVHLLPAVAVWLDIGLWERKAFRRRLLALPYYMLGAITASSLVALKASYGWQGLLPLIPLAFLIVRSSRGYLSRLGAVSGHARELADLHMRSIEVLALAIEAKDYYSHQQLDRVVVIATFLGEQLDLSPHEMDALRTASCLHHLGKLAIPGHVLSKPGKLTREEVEKLKTYPVMGAQILERVNFPYPVVPIVRHHQEKFNGGGYPDGLSGSQIPLGARILAVAETFVSLTSDRPEHVGITPDEAMARISLDSGISFDPMVVESLKKSYLHFDRRERPPGGIHLPATWNSPGASKPGPGSKVKHGRNFSESFVASIAVASQEEQSLFALALLLGNSLSLDETLTVFAAYLQRTIPYDTVAIFVRRDTILRPEYISGDNLRAFSSLEIPLGHGISGWAAENRKPVLNGNPVQETGDEETRRSMHAMLSALALPLEGSSGVVGVLSFYSERKDAFSPDHIRVLQALTPKLGMSIENALKYRLAEDSASTDYLTGLLNSRSLFLHLDSELARCRRLEIPLAILVSDLDGFKAVNDRFGHLEGNKVLQRVASKLKESCREYDCVSRMGGDEFVIVLPGLSKDAVRALIPRLREKVREASIEVLDEEVIGFSVGEAYFPADGKDSEQLLAEADKRMYQVKLRTRMMKEQQRGFAFDNTAG